LDGGRVDLQKKHLDISKQALGKRHELVEQRVFPAQASKQAQRAANRIQRDATT